MTLRIAQVVRRYRPIVKNPAATSDNTMTAKIISITNSKGENHRSSACSLRNLFLSLMNLWLKTSAMSEKPAPIGAMYPPWAMSKTETPKRMSAKHARRNRRVFIETGRTINGSRLPWRARPPRRLRPARRRSPARSRLGQGHWRPQVPRFYCASPPRMSPPGSRIA